MWRYPSPPTAWACRPTFCPSCFGSSPGLKATTGEAASPGGPGACHLQGDSAGPRWSHLSRERRVGHGSAVHLHDSDGRRGRERHSESTPSALDSFLAASCEGTSAHPLGGFAIHPPNCVQFPGISRPGPPLPSHNLWVSNDSEDKICAYTLSASIIKQERWRGWGNIPSGAHTARSGKEGNEKSPHRGTRGRAETQEGPHTWAIQETAATSATVSPLPNGPASRADRLGLVGLSSASAHSKRDRDGSGPYGCGSWSSLWWPFPFPRIQ